MERSASEPTPTIPPGWYADPKGLPTLRWWDGRQWTSSISPMPAQLLTQVQPPRRSGLQAEVPFTVKVIFGTLMVLLVLAIVGNIGG